MSDLATPSKFNQMVNQRLVIMGPEMAVEMLRRSVSAFNFMQTKIAKEVEDIDLASEFFAYVVDFQDMQALQKMHEVFRQIENLQGARLIVATAPQTLSQSDLLFGVEIGARQVFFGLRRDEEFRNYVKKRALEYQNKDSLVFYEREVMAAIATNNSQSMNSWQEKLSPLAKENEDMHRILALLSEARRDSKRRIFHLKQILTINPQNLWAANCLGRHFLMEGKASEGIEILRKLSTFSELNAERLLVLGDAYLNAGQAQEAAPFIAKGDQITGGQDPRFKEAQAKIQVVSGNASSALAILGSKHLSTNVLSFLNTRAVMLVRNKEFEAGLKLYEQALGSADPNSAVVRSKLAFNMGLAHIRNDQPELAEQQFKNSCEWGGDQFNRAAKPLEITKQVIAKRTKLAAAGTNTAQKQESTANIMPELEWEVLR